MSIQLNRVLMSAALAFSLLTLGGCGKGAKSDVLAEYHGQMETILDHITEINDSMNEINPDSETAVDELLSYFDALQEEFGIMADLTAPEQFSSIDELADEALENMITANEMYHEAFSNGSYNEYIAEAADEYYARVNKRLQFIILILHNETPEGDGVTVTTSITTTSPIESFRHSISAD